jgi:hypothetical protein
VGNDDIRDESRRVYFERSYHARIVSIDGTQFLDCEFFLVLSSIGTPAYRHCRLVWVEGERVGVRFLFRSAKDRSKVPEDALATSKTDLHSDS